MFVYEIFYIIGKFRMKVIKDKISNSWWYLRICLKWNENQQKLKELLETMIIPTSSTNSFELILLMSAQVEE